MHGAGKTAGQMNPPNKFYKRLDKKYNLNETKKEENLKLNAFMLEFNIEDNEFKITSALPKDFTNFLKLKNIKFNPKII